MRDILLILFSAFVGHILFLAVALLLNHKRSGNLPLGIILILLSIRVGKSVLALAFPDEALWLSLLGLASMAALGPLLYYYVAGPFSMDNPVRKSLLPQFIPAVLCCFAFTWPVLNPLYYVITLQMLIYLILAGRRLYQNREIYHVDNVRWKWGLGVLVGISIDWLCFLAQLFIYTPIFYLVVVGSSVLSLYGLSLWANQQHNLFVGPVKKKKDAEDVHLELGQKIQQLMEEEEIFIDPSLCLTSLAKRLNAPPYLVSRSVNLFFHKSFPELLTGYRLEKSKSLLISSLNKTFSIEGIAYESGFSTLSAFYSAFKKATGITPAQFRKRSDNADMRVA